VVVTLFSGHPHGDSCLMKRMVQQLSSEQYTSPYFEVKYVISDTNLQIKTFLSEYLVYAINQTIFFTYG